MADTRTHVRRDTKRHTHLETHATKSQIDLPKGTKQTQKNQAQVRTKSSSRQNIQCKATKESTRMCALCEYKVLSKKAIKERENKEKEKIKVHLT